MAATVTVENKVSLGGTVTLYSGTIAMDASYPSGGELIDSTGNERFDTLIASSTSGYVFSWDAANQKLLAYVSKDPGAVGGADIVLQQVANTTDLSAVTSIPFIAVGQ